MPLPTNARPVLYIRVKHTGVYADGRANASPVLITDLDVGYENQLRKVPCYVPVGGYIDIPASSRSMLSYEQGVIAKFVRAGVLTATMYFAPEVYTNATLPLATDYPPGASIWNSDQQAPNFSNGTNWITLGSGLIVKHETNLGVGQNARSLGTIAQSAASAAPTSQLGHYRTVDVSFPAGWTGGTVGVVGTDRYGAALTVLYPFPPGGGLVKGQPVFSMITSFTNSSVVPGGTTATVQSGTEIGTANLPLAFIKLAVGGVQEPFTVTDLPNGSFAPTTLPNGNRNYEVWYTMNILVV